MKTPMKYITIIDVLWKEVENIREKYKISFGLQYDAWEMTIKMPDWVEYASETEAHKNNEETTVFALLTADAIFLFYEGSIQKVFPDDREVYEFSFLNEDAYNRLGPPLSPDDIDALIEKGELESVIFSDRYMVTESDYTEFRGDSCDAYRELRKKSEPLHHMPDTGEFPESAGTAGYLFESIWYKAERIE